MRLLLLEDDTILGEGLRDFLQTDGHRVDWCQRLCEAKALTGEPYDALLVDWQLPDGSGVEWVAALRGRHVTTPALILTARDLLSDRIRGLDSGADDYLVKPFGFRELVARIRAVSRRSGADGAAPADDPATPQAIGGLRIDPDSGQQQPAVWLSAGTPIALQPACVLGAGGWACSMASSTRAPNMEPSSSSRAAGAPTQSAA